MKRYITVIISFLLLPIFITCNREDENTNIIPNAVTDIDGNSYDAVRIGNQLWMKANLRTTHFRDGSAIKIIEPDGYYETWNIFEPRYLNYPTGSDFGDRNDYGGTVLGFPYNGYAVVDNRGLCPEGWHIPTDADWIQLEKYVNSRSEWRYNGEQGAIAKALADKKWLYFESGWNIKPGTPCYEPDKNNATGFSAVYDGYLSCCRFWSRSEVYRSNYYYYGNDVDTLLRTREIWPNGGLLYGGMYDVSRFEYDKDDYYPSGIEGKSAFRYVRCLKD